MDLLYIFENIRTPFLDKIMLLITSLGEETIFLAITFALFWCIDKKKGYYLICIGLTGTIINQFLKIACQIPRPWIKDPDFTIVEAAREGATGYSFPSGHSQNAVGTFGGIAAVCSGKWLKYISAAVAILVPISRMYLGVHTPQDVLVGSGMALILLFLLRPILTEQNLTRFNILLAVMAVLAASFAIYVKFGEFSPNIDESNYNSALKNAYTLLGTVVGLIVVCWFDTRWIHFSTEAVWWVQILKFMIGIILTLAVKVGLKAAFRFLFPDQLLAQSVRYFLVVVTAGILWPLCFPFLRKLEKQNSFA